MPKKFVFFLSLTVVLITAFLTLTFSSNLETVSRDELVVAVNQAKYFYNQKKLRGEDMSSGPCLSNALMSGWVVDIVHSPRQAIDDLSENQCSAYSEGRAKHFIELDIDGNFVKAK